MKTTKLQKTGTAWKPFVLYLRSGISEKNEHPDMTQPQQVLPLQRILEHRQRGIPVPIFNGVFSEQDTDDLSKFDFVEIAELRERTGENIDLAKQDYHALTKRYEELRKLHMEAKNPKSEPNGEPSNNPS